MASRMLSRVVITMNPPQSPAAALRDRRSESVRPVISTESVGLGSLQSVLALLPVAGAELVGLQRVQHADHFLRVTADVEIGDVDETDDTLRVHDVRRTLCHARFRIEDAEAGRQLALQVREHREREILQLVLRATPREVHYFDDDADTEHLCVTRFELLVELAERRNLGGADEREILGPEEHDLPLPGEAVLGEGLERLVRLVRDDAREGKFRKTLTDT